MLRIKVEFAISAAATFHIRHFKMDYIESALRLKAGLIQSHMDMWHFVHTVGRPRLVTHGNHFCL